MKIFKEQYEFELQRKEQLGAALSVPLAIVSILGGILVFYAQHFPFTRDAVSIVFGFVFVGFGAALAAAIYFIFRSYTGYTYDYVASGPELKAWFDSLVDYYSRYGDGRDDAEREFEDGVNVRYIEATGRNAANNQSKAAYLNAASKVLAAATGLAILCAIPFFEKSRIDEEKAIRVEVIKLPKLQY